MAITLFELHNVARHFLGINIPIGWISSLSIAISIIISPFFAYLLNFLRKKHHTLSTPTLFLSGTIFMGLSLLCLSTGIIFANAHGYISFYWLIANLVFTCVASLCIDPVALNMLGELTPRLLQGTSMGIVQFSNAIAAILSSLITIHVIGNLHTTNPLSTNPHFARIFSTLGYAALAFAFMMLLCQPAFRRLQS